MTPASAHCLKSPAALSLSDSWYRSKSSPSGLPVRRLHHRREPRSRCSSDGPTRAARARGGAASTGPAPRRIPLAVPSGLDVFPPIVRANLGEQNGLESRCAVDDERLVVVLARAECIDRRQDVGPILRLGKAGDVQVRGARLRREERSGPGAPAANVLFPTPSSPIQINRIGCSCRPFCTRARGLQRLRAGRISSSGLALLIVVPFGVLELLRPQPSSCGLSAFRNRVGSSSDAVPQHVSK